MKYFVKGISAEVSVLRNTRDGSTEFYLLVISDEDTIDPATRRPMVLYTGTYSDPLDATEAAVVWTDDFRKKREMSITQPKAA